MQALLLSLGVFTAFHVIPALPPVRRALIGAMGVAAYIVGYSMISLGLLGWVGVAYAQAEVVELWPQAVWTRWSPTLLMLPACVLLVGAFVHANPLSVAARSQGFDAQRPGIVSVTRHPLMWALILWAGAHIPPNGDAASLVMFGFFALLGLAGPKSLDAKARRQLGEAEWARLAAATASVPFWAALWGRARIDWARVLCAPTLGGLVLYAVLMGGHLFVIGVSPLP